MRLRRIAEDGYTTLTTEDRAAFAAYTRGVNQFIATHRDNLPVEFTLLGYQPRPWSVVPADLPEHVPRPHHLVAQRHDQARVAGRRRRKSEFALVPFGGEPRPGSNGWAIAGSHTASASGSSRTICTLSTRCRGCGTGASRGAGLDVSGVALPGTPGMIVGHISGSLGASPTWVSTFRLVYQRIRWRGELRRPRSGGARPQVRESSRERVSDRWR